MAKAKPLTGLDPHAPTGQNARSIARTRLDEMYNWAADVDNPYEVLGLHNLRIAAKRLRYTLEIFEDVLPPAAQSIADELAQIQDELGALHDSDVMIALLRLCMGGEDAPRGGVCIVRNVEVNEGAIFSIEERQLTECGR